MATSVRGCFRVCSFHFASVALVDPPGGTSTADTSTSQASSAVERVRGSASGVQCDFGCFSLVSFFCREGGGVSKRFSCDAYFCS